MTHQNESEQPTGPRGLRRLREKAGLDRAVVLTLFTRAWQAIAGAISLLLIAKFFPPETQGFYYTFLSLLDLQIFIELARPAFPLVSDWPAACSSGVQCSSSTN